MKKAFNLLILIMAIAVFATVAVGCDSAEPECEHVWESEYKISEEGHWFACTLCGAKKGAQIHLWDTVVNEEPSCSETGLATLTCKICDFSTQSVLPTINHNAGSDFFNNDGIHWQECVDCGEDLNTAAHQFNIRSYNLKGHWYSCECGVSTELQQHSWVSAGDEAPGKEVCSAPECRAMRDEIGESHEHIKAVSEVLEEATCEKSGTIEYCCSCGYAWTESIKPLHHTYSSEEWEYDDLYHWHNCVCGKEAPESEKVLHSYSNTPTIEGLEKVYKCECGKSKNANDSGYIDPDGWEPIQ